MAESPPQPVPFRGFMRAYLAYVFLFDFMLAYAIYTAFFELQGISVAGIGILLAFTVHLLLRRFTSPRSA